MLFDWTKKAAQFVACPTVVWSVIGLYFTLIILGYGLDLFIPQVEVGQDIATMVGIMGKPTEKYMEPEMIDGLYVDGASVLVYYYKMSGPGAGDVKIYLKNGQVVGRSGL